jgi:hypothetical protein
METHMDKINPRACGIIETDALAALAAVAERHNLTLTREPGRYDDFNFNFKAKFTVVTSDGAPADFAQNAVRLGLPEDCWGREIRHRNEKVTIAGFAMRRTKYPVVVKRHTGGSIFLTVDGVKGQLALADIEAKQVAAS